MAYDVYPHSSLPGMGYSLIKRPTWNTRIHRSASGREARAALYVYPHYEFELTYPVLRHTAAQPHLETILGFYNERKGAFEPFLFIDPSDSTVSGQGIGTGDGVEAEFQLVRTYGGFTEPKYYINEDEPLEIYVDGVLQLTPDHYEVDDAGLVTFDGLAVPGMGTAVTARFSYYYLVRFKEDYLDAEGFDYNLWRTGTVGLVTVR